MSELAAFAVTCIAILLLPPVARRFNLVDRPGGRKVHDGNVPLIGGIAVSLGLMAGVALHPLLRTRADVLLFVLSAVLMLIVGVIDDKRGLSPKLRIAATILIALLVVRLEDFQLHSLGDLAGMGEVSTGLLAIPFTLFCIVGVVNALNMADGVDGLAGGLTAVALAGMAWAAWLAKEPRMVALLSILLAAVAAFLCFNVRTPFRKRASVFMGDGGSMFLGFVLATLFTTLSQAPLDGVRIMTPTTALWLLALPLMDAVRILIRRALSGRSPFAADREHLHHVLLAAGYTPGEAVFILLVLASLLMAVGLLGHFVGAPEPVMLGGFLLLFFIYCLGMNFAKTL